jgi:hypothetical protein
MTAPPTGAASFLDRSELDPSDPYAREAETFPRLSDEQVARQAPGGQAGTSSPPATCAPARSSASPRLWARDRSSSAPCTSAGGELTRGGAARGVRVLGPTVPA